MADAAPEAAASASSGLSSEPIRGFRLGTVEASSLRPKS